MGDNVTNQGNHGGSLYFSDISPTIIAAHELKAPLALLRQLSLSLDSDDLSKAERKEIVDHMTLTSERAIRLTTDLTQSEKLQTRLFEFEPINSQQMCEEVVYELLPLYQAHGRDIRVSRRRRSLLAVANKDLLRRVLLNFADNALYYGDANTPIELWTSSRNNGATIRLGVRDYGPAVPMNTLEALRDNLYCLQPPHARPSSSGLGLYIARQFAEAMNGTIGTVRHKDGATFYVDMQASRQLRLL